MNRTAALIVLVLATLAMDGLATVWVFKSNSGSNLTYPIAIWNALAISQCSIVSIWSVLRSQYSEWSWILPLGAFIIATAMRHSLGVFGQNTLVYYATRAAMQMLLLVVVLWVLVRSRIWRKISGRVPRKWEFSLRQVLAWMTAVAFVSALVAHCEVAETGRPMPLLDLQGITVPAILALNVVIISELEWNWVLRIAAYVTSGVLAGIIMAAYRNWVMLAGPFGGMDLAAILHWPDVYRLGFEFTIQALMIAAWLELGRIAPILQKKTSDRDRLHIELQS